MCFLLVTIITTVKHFQTCILHDVNIIHTFIRFLSSSTASSAMARCVFFSNFANLPAISLRISQFGFLGATLAITSAGSTPIVFSRSTSTISSSSICRCSTYGAHLVVFLVLIFSLTRGNYRLLLSALAAPTHTFSCFIDSSLTI